MSPPECHPGCDMPMCVRDHRDLPTLDLNEPALADAVLREPGDALLRFANPWMRRQHFDRQVWRTTHAITDDPCLLIGYEHQIRLDDQRALFVEDHVERRQPHFP